LLVSILLTCWRRSASVPFQRAKERRTLFLIQDDPEKRAWVLPQNEAEGQDQDAGGFHYQHGRFGSDGLEQVRAFLARSGRRRRCQGGSTSDEAANRFAPDSRSSGSAGNSRSGPGRRRLWHGQFRDELSKLQVQ